MSNYFATNCLVFLFFSIINIHSSLSFQWLNFNHISVWLYFFAGDAQCRCSCMTERVFLSSLTWSSLWDRWEIRMCRIYQETQTPQDVSSFSMLGSTTRSAIGPIYKKNTVCTRILQSTYWLFSSEIKIRIFIAYMETCIKTFKLCL